MITSISESSFEPSTLVEILRRRVLHQPDRLAYTFLLDGETGEAHLTYTDLDQKARAIGARLQSLGASGERALLLYPPGLEFITGFFGCLYAGVVAVPVYPPYPARLDSNLLHNSALMQRCFEHSSESRGIIWVPPYHDMGLIAGILQPFYLYSSMILMSPMAFLQRPLRWLQAISRTRATTSGGPNFAYDLCVRKITPEQRAALDLSSWDVACIGAEPVRPETLERFAATFAPCGFRRAAFYPCYGLAEATLIASGGLKAAPPIDFTVQSAALERNRVAAAPGEDAGARTLVGCGQSLGDQKIVIVHPETLTRCSSDEVGEIWIAGPSVAQGYWNQPEDTERTFHAYLADTGEGPFLRTGDLGFLRDGELFVTGRLKDLIINDGYNHYPQDIELTVEQSYPALRPGCCAAFSVDVAGQERLVIVAEVERRYLPRRVQSLDTKEVVQAIRRAVAEYHELSVYAVSLLKPGTIPKTSSGKIQRHVCRTNFLAGSLDVIEK